LEAKRIAEDDGRAGRARPHQLIVTPPRCRYPIRARMPVPVFHPRWRASLRRFALLLGLSAGSALAGCQSEMNERMEDLPRWRPGPIEEPLYRTAPGDVLVIEYARTLPDDAGSSEYLIHPGDELSIVFESRPEFSRDVLVRPDGKFSYFRIGEVEVRGKSVAEVTRILSEKFVGIVSNPSITVFVNRLEVAQDRFFDTLLQGPGGSSRDAVLRADGAISLPLIGQVPLADLTMSEAEERLGRLYRERGIWTEVSLNVKSFGNHRCVVLGEVKTPGSFALTSGVTVAEAVATVGGELASADLSKVVWITQGPGGERQFATVDLEGYLAGKAPAQNPYLRPGDVLYVPRSGIGDINRWVELYLRENMPFNLSLGIGWRF